jgi:hypothetical protein
MMMLKQRSGRSAGPRRKARVVALAAVSIAALGGASPALASEHHPTGDFTPFADCPLSNAAVQQCVLSTTTSGKFTIGTRTVPIEGVTVTLQGGIHESASGAQTFYGAEDGDTLSKTELAVPGGLLGIVAPEYLPVWLQDVINSLVSEGLAGVTATAELAKPATDIAIDTENFLEGEGVALTLPTKVKLSNTFLGGSCYIGSYASPITLNLTSGTTSPPEPNTPLTGSKGTPDFEDNFNLVVFSPTKLVDNAFSAPGASGCGGLLSFLIDPAIDAELALPSAAGHNTAILEGKLEQANARAVEASE